MSQIKYLRSKDGENLLDNDGKPIPAKRNASPGAIVRPPCPTHGDTMRHRGSSSVKRYWYCCVLGCQYSKATPKENRES